MHIESIAEKLFFTTVRIDTIAQDGANGSGTGFIFLHKTGEKFFPAVVTNKHVVTDMRSGAGVAMRSGTINFHRKKDGKPELGKGFRLTIDDWSKSWFGHPSPDIDIAISPLVIMESEIKKNWNIDLFYSCVSNELIPTKDQLAEIDALESVTFIGYPNGIWDQANQLPVARRGTTASPLEVDFENTPRFLIDASVFGGSSGSPVFLFNQGMYSDKSGNTYARSRCHFIGVIAEVYYRDEVNKIIALPIPTQLQPASHHREMIDLGVVFKANTVVETIEAYLSTRA